jgi:hypothetical protein
MYRLFINNKNYFFERSTFISCWSVNAVTAFRKKCCTKQHFIQYVLGFPLISITIKFKRVGGCMKDTNIVIASAYRRWH